MARQAPVVLGVQGHVLALDPSTGEELWRTGLKGAGFVNVTLQGNAVIATTRGEVFALDAATGHINWHNKLKGLGLGFVTIAGSGQVPSISAMQASQQMDAGTMAVIVSSS
jgi:PQQ-like domain